MEEMENRETGILEEELCRKCHARQIDRSESKNSILCHTCREEQIRYPFPKKAMVAAAAICVILVAAMVRTPRVLHDYKLYTEAKTQAAVGDIYPALLGLEEVMEHYPDSVPVGERMVDLAMAHGYYDAAAYAMNTYLSGKSVSDSTYSKLTGYSKKLNRYYDTSDRIEELMSGMTLNQSEEEQREALEEIRSELLSMTEQSEYDKSLAYYYLALLSEDEGKVIGYLEKSAEADPLFAVPNVYLGTYYRRMGRLDEARACYDNVLTVDRQNSSALRAMGILNLLEGNLKEGLSHIQTAYDINPEEEYINETLIIALMENGKIEEAEHLKQEFDEQGAEFDADFQQYLSGAVGLRDYYIDVP